MVEEGLESVGNNTLLSLSKTSSSFLTTVIATSEPSIKVKSALYSGFTFFSLVENGLSDIAECKDG